MILDGPAVNLNSHIVRWFGTISISVLLNKLQLPTSFLIGTFLFTVYLALGKDSLIGRAVF